MRRLILIIMALTLATTMPNSLSFSAQANAAEATQSHRSQYSKHHKADTAAATSKAHPIDAFSDTTSAPSSAADTASYAASAMQGGGIDYDSPFYDNDSDFEHFISALMSYGPVAGVLMALIGALFVICICLLPFLAIILPIIYLIKRNNNKTRLAEKMIENGVPLTQENAPITITEVDGIQRGIRQSAIGVGLFLMGVILSINVLMAIGVLVLAIGVGKVISAKYAAKHKQSDEQAAEDVTEE